MKISYYTTIESIKSRQCLLPMPIDNCQQMQSEINHVDFQIVINKYNKKKTKPAKLHFNRI